MSSIISHLDRVFRAAIKDAFNIEADPIVGLSQNEKFGDYQSNAAMGLAKTLKSNPRAVAEQIKAKLALGEMASETSIAGPGFINVRLSQAWLAKQLHDIAEDQRLGIEPVEQPQNVVVDYSAPNVAKQMHVGNLRSTIIGDAICRVLAFAGHHVIRQNHIGDWGTQFGMLIAFLEDSSSGADAKIEDLDKFYKQARARFDAEPAFADKSRATVVALQAGNAKQREVWNRILTESRRYFETTYSRLGILLTPDDERGESFYNPMLGQVVSDLRNAGIARESEGAIVAFTEGSEAPLIVEKTGGGHGYATTDLAAVRYRVTELKANRIIYVVGSPQAQHFKQVFDIARRASWTKNASLEHAGFGSILGADGKMFKTRSGESVKLLDLLDEAVQRAFDLVTKKNPDLPEEQRKQIARAVGIGAVKYADLSKDRLGDYTFNWDTMLALDGNTAPYLQYVYARIRSIFRKSEGIFSKGTTLLLENPFEFALAKHILRLDELIDLVARELKPHHLCTYLYDLASKFSGFYENCPVLKSEEPIRSSRLLLCDLTARTMRLGLDLLGIEHPEQM